MRLSVAFVIFLSKLVETHNLVRPRLEFTNKETTLRSIPLPHNLIKDHIQLVEDGKDRVIVKADQQLYSLDFVTKNHTTSHGSSCEDHRREEPSCTYSITVLHKRKGTNNQVFMCETHEKQTTCCNKDLSSSADCGSSDSLKGIASTIKGYRLRTGEPSVFIESPEGEVLYVTQSSTENSIGIYKFGSDRVRPTTPDNALQSVEPQYLGLVAFTGKNTTQDKLYAFFKEKNTAGGVESDMWLPFVAQVCMADKGGPKTKLQYQWTSQLKARLFCGHNATRQHFPELLDVAFHHDEDGRFSRVYALFRNEWNMRAVCVFSREAISKVFQTSSFKGNKEKLSFPRPGTCAPFKGQPEELLRRLSFVQSHPEMDDRVFSENGPLLVSEHHYTHIRLHAVHNQGRHRHMLLYLSLESGKVHKVLENKTGGFIIAAFSPFRDKEHILDMILQGAEKKLYVSSRKEVVQVELQSCAQYAQHCEDCVMARDPYCGWDGRGCVAANESKTLQDVEKGNPSICGSGNVQKGDEQGKSLMSVPPQSMYFLHCHITSRHAEYTWHLPGNATKLCRATEDQCELLIDTIGPEKEGDYRCMAEEHGYKRTLVLVRLQVERSETKQLSSAAGLGRYGGPSVGWVLAISLLQLAAIFLLQNAE